MDKKEGLMRSREGHGGKKERSGRRRGGRRER